MVGTSILGDRNSGADLSNVRLMECQPDWMGVYLAETRMYDGERCSCAATPLANDITSDTFIRLNCSGPDLGRDGEGISVHIARNLYHDFLRGQRRHGNLYDSIADRRADSQRQTEMRFELELALAAMRELAESNRAALILDAQEEMSYEEILVALNLPLTAVKGPVPIS